MSNNEKHTVIVRLQDDSFPSIIVISANRFYGRLPIE